MTEEEWLTSTSPFKLGEHPAIAESKRKVRLYAVACCRRLAQWFHDTQLKDAVDAAEKYADGELTIAALEQWNTVANDIHATGPQPGSGPMRFPPQWQANLAVITATHYDEHVNWNRLSRIVLGVVEPSDGEAVATAQDWLCRVIRDIFGNPFRPVAFDPAWRTSTTVALAKGMYESRDFGAMPILGDALQDAGCDSDDVLNHCRDVNGVHVRGCWVVDLVLGKS